MSFVQSIAATRSSALYGVRVLKSSDAPAQLAAPVEKNKPHIDLGKMAVTAVLTTRTPDRQGDIVDPFGGDLTEHTTNPVVMFHHAKDYKLPIGKAEDPQGNYTVRPFQAHDGELLIGTTYFAQNDKFASDVFNLVAQDIMRGVSIGFDPLPHEDSVLELGQSPTLDRPALHFKGWKLLEYSHTPIGVNRDALTVAYHKSLDGSQKLHPVLERVLKPFASPRVATVAGGAAVEKACGPMSKKPKRAAMNKTRKRTYKADDLDDDDLDADVDGSGGSMGDEAGAPPSDFDPTVDDPSDDPDLPTNTSMVRDEDETPPSVQAHHNFAQAVLDAAMMFEQDLKRGEHPELRAKGAKIIAEARKLAAEISGDADRVHGELAGVLDKADSGMTDDDGDADDSELEETNSDVGDDDSDMNADEDAGESPETPDDLETDDDGAIVTKGGYVPRRLHINEIPQPRRQKAKPVVPAADTSELAQQLKALEAERDAAIAERDEIATAFEEHLDNFEAGRRRGR